MFNVLVRKTNGGRLISFIVSDRSDGWDDYDKQWPWIVEFNVSLRYDGEAQRQRAHEYCAYLNKHIQTIPAIGE